mmetsp:Transcript_126737/g.354860  ORF Transcript_126737/g.354860 Transcript_126737/m.354860 type:complete len:207 (-) Transcript_126737:1111-1731(-)
MEPERRRSGGAQGGAQTCGCGAAAGGGRRLRFRAQRHLASGRAAENEADDPHSPRALDLERVPRAAQESGVGGAGATSPRPSLLLGLDGATQQRRARGGGRQGWRRLRVQAWLLAGRPRRRQARRQCRVARRDIHETRRPSALRQRHSRGPRAAGLDRRGLLGHSAGGADELVALHRGGVAICLPAIVACPCTCHGRGQSAAGGGG